MAIATLFIILSFFLILHRHGGSAASSTVDEIRSLLEFRKGIKLDPSNRINSTWILPSNPSVCPRDFYGVVCDANSASVVAIALDRLGLVGELKFNTLVPLKSLQNLTLAGNSLSGRLVPVLGTMSSLQLIDLSRNQFYGPIPSRLTDLWGLNYLDLSGNTFSGEMPNGVRNWQQLRVLDLHSNQLQGDVGALIPELRNVNYLDLSANNFSGSIEFGVENVSSLANTVQFVNMSGNGLGGEFWGKDMMMLFRNLNVLDLSYNGITGKIQDIGQLPNLHVLRLRNNHLSGSVPEGLLQGEVPLTELDLSGNQFSGSISKISSTTLGILNLSSNSISGSLLLSIGNCCTLDLSRNFISGDIANLNTWNMNLEILDLSFNRLTGMFPNLVNFRSLISINLGNNGLEGNLPSELGSLRQLNTIDLSSNHLEGPIPDSFFTSVTLTNLNLSYNSLTGPIPLDASRTGELLVLSSDPPMESIDLSSNFLTGRLASSIGNWGRLKFFSLAHNNLSGPLPDELSKLGVLENLNISYNGFSGKVPDKLPSSLKSLDISYNKFSGEIPKNLNYIPDSSFSGNDLKPRHGMTSGNQVPDTIGNGVTKHPSSSSVRVAIILASVVAVTMVLFVLIVYRRTQFDRFRRGFCVGKDDKSGRFPRPTFLRFHNSTETPQASLNFSNDQLLVSNPSGQIDSGPEVSRGVLPGRVTFTTVPENIHQQDDHPSTSGRKSSPEAPVLSSPQLSDVSESGPLEVYSPDRLVGELYLLDNSLAVTAEELSRAPAEVLGRSSHGTLYKATLDNGNVFTVKWLRVGLVKRKKEFGKEVKRIGSIRHPNIIPLRAYYWGPREQERLVLADYIAGDSLVLHLYETTPRRNPPLSFIQRLKVAIDIACGLIFLHEHGLPHGNLKPSNIILSGPELTARLSDYSLYRLMTSAGVFEQMLTLGALGYRAPELATAHKPGPSFKADIYAFGVILMELLTRRSAGDIISGQSGAVDLTDWVRLCDQEGRRMGCIDRDIAGGEEEYLQAMDKVLGVALKCILPVKERPNIREVLEELSSV